jgi:hypothetical protein
MTRRQAGLLQRLEKKTADLALKHQILRQEEIAQEIAVHRAARRSHGEPWVRNVSADSQPARTATAQADEEEASSVEQQGNQHGWLAAFFREVICMPRRHVVVFLVATILLVVAKIELVEGWHLIHLVELVGVMVFLYLLWAAWRVSRRRNETLRVDR